MLNLHQDAALVQSPRPRIHFVGLPETLRDDRIGDFDFDGDGDCERFLSPEDVGFEPNPADEAWDLGYRLGRAGEKCSYGQRYGTHVPSEVSFAFIRGRTAGEFARQVEEARELGRALGLSGSGIGEPPSGYRPEAQEAYRAGYAEGLAEFEEDRDFEAWVASEEAERSALAFSTSITDLDVYPAGCVS